MSADGTRGKLGVYLKTLKLPSFAADHEALARLGEEGGWSFERYLAELCEREVADRQERRIERILRQSRLPLEKTRETLIEKKLSAKARRQLAALYEGSFLERAENVLVFGLPGRGKSHAICALGHELVRKGHAVLFLPTYELVQQLLKAKRDLVLGSVRSSVWTATRPSSSTTSGMCSRPARRWRCSSRFCRRATSGAACCSRATWCFRSGRRSSRTR